MSMKYLVVIEETETGFSAYSPDLPGCITTGDTREEVERNMQEGILFHLEGIQEKVKKVSVPFCCTLI